MSKDESEELNFTDFVDFFHNMEDLDAFGRKAGLRQLCCAYILRAAFLVDLLACGFLTVMLTKIDESSQPAEHQIHRNALIGCGSLLAVLVYVLIIQPWVLTVLCAARPSEADAGERAAGPRMGWGTWRGRESLRRAAASGQSREPPETRRVTVAASPPFAVAAAADAGVPTESCVLTKSYRGSGRAAKDSTGAITAQVETYRSRPMGYRDAGHAEQGATDAAGFSLGSPVVCQAASKQPRNVPVADPWTAAGGYNPAAYKQAALVT